MEILKHNWPLVLIALYFAYRMIRSYQVKKLLPTLKARGAILMDVRSQAEYASGHAPGSINVPLNTLSTELHKYSPNQTIVVCCASGTRSAMARKILQKNGFKETYNAGTWKTLVQ